MSDFWSCAAAEFWALGWRCVAYGPEFWLAVMIWCIGAACGIVWIWVMATIKRRNKK